MNPSRSRFDTTDAMFIYNNLYWETDSVYVKIRVNYSGTSINMRNYIEDIEKDSTLTDVERCSLVEKKIDYSYNNIVTKANYYRLKEPTKIAGLYYYSDIMRARVKFDRIAHKFLFIPYYRRRYEIETYYKRYVFVDSVVYCLSVELKAGARALKNLNNKIG